jgi:hypothetical protein
VCQGGNARAAHTPVHTRIRLATDNWLNAPEEKQIIAEPQLENFDRETV